MAHCISVKCNSNKKGNNQTVQSKHFHFFLNILHLISLQSGYKKPKRSKQQQDLLNFL